MLHKQDTPTPLKSVFVFSRLAARWKGTGRKILYPPPQCEKMSIKIKAPIKEQKLTPLFFNSAIDTIKSKIAPIKSPLKSVKRLLKKKMTDKIANKNFIVIPPKLPYFHAL